jgi:PPOX class probable F420-dependent enzyme
VVFDLDDLPDELTDFVGQRRTAALTLVRPNGTPQVTPVGVTWDPETRLARVITWADAVKARLLRANLELPAATCEVDGGHWLTMSGVARLTDDPDRVGEAVRRYTARYKPPKDRPDRVAIEISVESITGRLPLR